MDDVTRRLLTQWIHANHDHHEGAARSVASLDLENQTMSAFEDVESTATCTDGDKPYVNSLALEEFIKTL